MDQWNCVMNALRLQALYRLPPNVGCEARRRTCSERETRTEELYEIKWDYHIVGTMGRFGTKPASDEATMINYIGVTNVARQR
jgi:hypothetical protein